MVTKNNIDYGDYTYFIYGLVKQLEPQTILEVGLGPFGNTAGIILDIFTTDERYKEKNPRYTVIDNDPTDEARELLNSYDKKFWDLRVGDSAQMNLFAQKGAMVDIALIDGNHSTQYCFTDTYNLLMNNNFDAMNSLLVFHDTRMPTVTSAIKKLQEEFDLDVFFLPQNASIALAKIKV